jgi:hypothetical protein
MRIMGMAMPAALVLIVCKTIIGVGPPDQNAEWTKHEDRDWATENSMMVCRRYEVSMADPTEGMVADNQQGIDPTKETGALPQPFNEQRCLGAGIRMFPAWDEEHKNGPWRAWRVACPVPIINTITKEIIDWKMPECGHRDTVVCEVDSVI